MIKTLLARPVEMKAVLAFTIVVGFMYVLTFLLFSEKHYEILNMMVGGLVAKFGDVINYFFGSTKESTNKTKMLHLLATKDALGGANKNV